MNAFKIQHKLSLQLAPVALSLWLAGCAVGPEYQQPTVSIAESYLYSTHEQSGEVNQWWTLFNDPTLTTLVNDVQQQNIPLKLAAQRIKMANNYQSIIESFKVPTINVGAGYYNYQLSENSSLMGPVLSPLGEGAGDLSGMTLVDNQHDGAFVGASISWEVDLLGRIEHQANAASIRVEQATLYANSLNTIITADLIHNYLQYRGAQARISLAKLNIQDQQESISLVKKVVQHGYGSELDLAQAEASLAAMESIIPQLEVAQQVHKRRIATLLGEPLTNIEIRLASAQDLPIMRGIIPIGLPSELLLRRPDIKIAEREMAAINEELAASIANRYPKFFLTGTPGVSASSFDDLFSGDSIGWAGAVGVNWNVFDGGRGKAAVKLNETRFESAALGYEYTVNSAIVEVDSMLFTYGRSQENEQKVEQALKASEKVVNKATSLYHAGLIDHLTVLDAQRQKRLIEDRQLIARLQVAQVTVSVYKALGGDWSTPTEAKNPITQ